MTVLDEIAGLLNYFKLRMLTMRCIICSLSGFRLTLPPNFTNNLVTPYNRKGFFKEWFTYRGVSIIKPAQEQVEPTVCESPSCVYELVLDAWPKS